MDALAPVVSPEGLRDGDPAALETLSRLRGEAVLAYARHVSAPDRVEEARDDAFSRFRSAVAAADDALALDAERELLRATRLVAAACAPAAAPSLRSRLRGGGASACSHIPELLAARAEGSLHAGDRERVARHLVRCVACRDAEARFVAGERAYRDAAPPPPQPAVASPQPTIEFERLPDTAFDVAPAVPEPRPGPLLRIALPAAIVAATIAVALAVAGVLYEPSSGQREGGPSVAPGAATSR